MSLTVPLDEIFSEKVGLLANHKSWERVELHEVCSILNGFPFKSSLFNKDKGFPIIRIRDLSKNTAETLYNGEVPKEFIAMNGDFLIGMDGMFRCVEWRGGKAGLNQRVCKIVPAEQFLAPRFLLYGLNGYLKAIEEATSSVTVGHLSSRDILKIPFPLPPFSEQRRIVAKLDEVLGKLELSQKRLEKISVILKRFRQSVLAAACSGRLTADWREQNQISTEPEADGLPAGWKAVCVGDVVESLKYGTAQKCGYEKQGLPVLRIPNVVNGVIDHTDLKYAKLPSKESEQLKLCDGDILLIRSNGSVSLVGRCALVGREHSGFAYAGYLIRIRPKNTLVIPKFLNLVLSSYDIRLQIELEARSTSGVNNINSEEVKALRFSLPPTGEQQEIARRVESFFALADQIEVRFQKAKAQVDRFTPSILAKAFRGELVPHNPSDEPAKALLKRIRDTKGVGTLTLPKKRTQKSCS